MLSSQRGAVVSHLETTVGPTVKRVQYSIASTLNAFTDAREASIPENFAYLHISQCRRGSLMLGLTDHLAISANTRRAGVKMGHWADIDAFQVVYINKVNMGQ